MYKIIKKDTKENVTKKTAVTSKGIVLVSDDFGNYHMADSNLYEVREYPIPSKEDFKKLIHDIRDINLRTDKLNTVIQEISIDSIFYFPTLETTILEYLSHVFNDKSDWIYYFIAELEYGNLWKPGMVTENGKDYKLATTDDLYDLLVKNLNT